MISSFWVFILIVASLILIGSLYYLLSLKAQRTQKRSKKLIPSKTESLKEEKTLQEALAKTRQPLLKGIHLLNKRGGSLKKSSEEMEQLEELLYASDMGPKVAEQLLRAIQKKSTNPTEASSSHWMQQKLKEEMLHILSPITSMESTDSMNAMGLNSTAPITETVAHAGFHFADSNPSVWLFMGVNGVGKTTTIGKLAAQLAEQNKQVLVVASDTFRAAADKQLEVWTQRAQVHLFNPPQTKDPAAIAFDAVAKAKAKNMDVVLVDTAGRLHTYDHLMQELEKIKRVITKQIPSAPHESLLILDANSGQNALHQARQFLQRMELTGVILTKLDSSAKGGIVFALASELQLPVKGIGIGEGLKDLRPFSAKEFVHSILGSEPSLKNGSDICK